jgi:hypothetical protein
VPPNQCGWPRVLLCDSDSAARKELISTRRGWYTKYIPETPGPDASASVPSARSSGVQRRRQRAATAPLNDGLTCKPVAVAAHPAHRRAPTPAARTPRQPGPLGSGAGPADPERRQVPRCHRRCAAAPRIVSIALQHRKEGLGGGDSEKTRKRLGRDPQVTLKRLGALGRGTGQLFRLGRGSEAIQNKLRKAPKCVRGGTRRAR